jgi:hypothetical protein
MQFKYIASLTIILLVTTAAAPGADLSADQIMDKAAAVYAGDDAVETISFILQQADEPQRKLTYTMAWKKYDDGNFVRKVIFFTQFPPDKRGEAYMAWFYPSDLHKDDDAWIYLPDLRSIRKIGHKHHAGHGGEDDEKDEFSKSVLKDEDLMPRPPGLDTHRLLKTEDIDGKTYYVVENVPKSRGMAGMSAMQGMMDMAYDYAKTVEWIDSEHFLVTHIDYYAPGDDLSKSEDIEWKQIGKAWVWSKIHAVDHKSQGETTIEISDIRVNAGLTDRVFSKRAMRLGLASVLP